MNNIKALKKKDYIRVYNHSSSPVILSMRDKQETVEPKNENDTPGYVDVSWNDVYFINDRTNTFKHGLLRFAKDDEEAMYEALGIFDWADILFEEVIEDIVLHPTLERLQRIVDTTSISIIERAKSVMTLLNNQDVDVSAKVTKIINIRRAELSQGKRRSDISLSPKEIHKAADKNEVTELKNEIAELKAMVEQLSKAKA